MCQEIREVIITGASGPLGVMLIRECIKNNIGVLAIIRPGSSNRKNIPMHKLVRIVECEITNIDKIAVKGKYEVCFHLAWTHTGDRGRNDPFLQEENILATLKTARFSMQMGCKVFIGAGSQAEYGILNKKVNEESEERPNTLYGITKLAAGRLVMEYCRQNGMRCNWVRIFAVYGPYENNYIFTSYVIRTLLDGKEPELTPCEQIWDYLYTEDAVHALWLIAKKGKSSGVYCLGSGEPKRIKDYVLIIRDKINPNISLGIGKRAYSAMQTMHLEADITKLQTDIGYAPHFSFEEGIARTIEWYKSERR